MNSSFATSSLMYLLLCLQFIKNEAKSITFGIVLDSNGYGQEFIEIIKIITNALPEFDVSYSIKLIDTSLPLSQQLDDMCYSETDFEVLLSATSCDILRSLAQQSESMGMLHFAVNVDHCPPIGHSVFLDRISHYDVTQAIADVIQERNKKADLVVLHDTKYEKQPTVRSLLRELIRRGIKYSYLIFETDITKVYRRMVMVRRGAKELSVLVLGDFSEFKYILDQMYDQNRLDPTVSYLIVNDGWEATNPEIEVPQRVSYNLDLMMLLLKRKISDQFSLVLHEVLITSKESNSSKFQQWKTRIDREDLFASAVVWSVVESSKTLWNFQEQNLQKKCSYFNTSESPDEISFKSLVLNRMKDIGVLAGDLQYALLRNIPVDSETEMFRHIADWKASVKPRFRYLNKNIETQLLFENRTLKIALPYNPPYTFTDGKVQGAVGKLFDYLVKRLKFKYEVVCPEDNEWGVLMENEEWTGAVGMLLNRTADLVPFLGITRGRDSVLEFSEPVMTTSSSILVQRPREPPRTLIFLRPFSKHVWLLILTTVPIMACILCFIHRKSSIFVGSGKKEMRSGLSKFSNCLWYMYGAILQQGGIHLPNTLSARTVVCFWWLFVMVVMATYSGNLIAFLTFPEADWKVTSLEDLASKESIIIALKEGTSIHQEILESPVETLKRLKYRFENDRNAMLVANVTSILPLIRKGKAVFLEDFYVLSDLISTDHKETGRCLLALAPEAFLEIYLAIAARRGSPYMKDINSYIRQLWHGGLMQHWAKRFSNLDTHECYFITTTLRGGRKDVTLRDLLGAFLMLLCGLCIASSVILAEVAYVGLKKLLATERTSKKLRLHLFMINIVKTKNIKFISGKGIK
ncbi:glutamate receptor ionotropic, delta-1-like [Stegodyphus dumicola]|uniref:glutamate receptor ionotropic, delta-1-like n=1 Tax=Stegodyphus dumicola TaxID=202533 RepID=UPI0015B27D9D|nr:glutamate receptor ionotropic, delta-1-like [Stegodyphus dumicola]